MRQPTKNTSTLNTTKSETPFYSFSQILKYSINKICNKYSTSHSYYISNNIQLAIKNKKCRLKQFLKDEEYNKQDEILEQYYHSEEIQVEIPELTEYYKYYTQTSIIYQVNYFKMMHNYREKRKICQYNKLKIMLNLSGTTEHSSVVEQKDHNNTHFSSFYILSKLNQTNNHEESLLLVKLNHKLAQEYGPNQYGSIEEIDQNYFFQKKTIQNDIQKTQKIFKKLKTLKNQKQNQNNSFVRTNSRFHAHRNNSCESLTNQKKISLKHRQYKKKKHQSMDNFNQFTKQECGFKQLLKLNDKTNKIKDSNSKLIANWMRSTYTNIDKSKIYKANINKKITHVIKDSAYEMKEKIMMAKERIKKEKQMLKKKVVCSGGATQNIIEYKNSKKLISMIPSEKNTTRNLIRMHVS